MIGESVTAILVVSMDQESVESIVPRGIHRTICQVLVMVGKLCT